MGFPNIRITEAGRLLMAEVLAGAKLQFTHFVIGSGECGSQDDWEGLTGPINRVMDVSISNYQRDGEVATLHGEFSNSEVDTEFWWRELCIYATLPDVENYGSVMCFYGNAEKLAEFVPASDSSVNVTHRWDTSLKVDSDADVSAVVHSVTYATNEQLNKHIEDQTNPHKVTKAQVGLGSVPNVSTNNQTPTYTVPKLLAALTNGERLYIAFGKIAKAVQTLIDHLEDFKNPHKVTYELTGGAKKMHRSVSTEYGMANATYFGHAKLSDATDSPLGASDGFAASPKAVKKAYDQAIAASSISGVYVGEGRCGKDNPNEIVFEGRELPKAVLIFEKSSSPMFIRYGQFIIAETGECVGCTHVDGVDTMMEVTHSGRFTMDSEGNGGVVYTALQWYYDTDESHPANQLDTKNSTFVWVAIY